MSKVVGDQGEAFVATLLRGRGYDVREIGGNYPVIDLEVDAATPFRVSVKTSIFKRHVRMGTERSVSRLRDDDFVFAIVPTKGSASTELTDGGYELLIIPGKQAREDALRVHHTYLETTSRSGAPRSGSAGIIINLTPAAMLNVRHGDAARSVETIGRLFRACVSEVSSSARPISADRAHRGWGQSG